MSSAEQYVRTEHPVIDSDPHFNRVIRYMRGSDYVAWGALTAGTPAVLLALGNSLFKEEKKGARRVVRPHALVDASLSSGFAHGYQEKACKKWSGRKNAATRTGINSRQKILAGGESEVRVISAVWFKIGTFRLISESMTSFHERQEQGSGSGRSQ